MQGWHKGGRHQVKARGLSRAIGAALLVASQFMAVLGQAATADPLYGSWCDDTGYRIDIGPEGIAFRDRQMGDPPSGIDLVVKNGVATYRQDFRNSAWPHIGLLDCSLRLLGENAAAETCSGTGYGYMPFFALKRCPQDVIS
jgi:hypothetical protein